VPDVLDVCLGILELARPATAFAEVAVVERQCCIPALGHGLSVGAGRLLLHRGQRADGNHNADRPARLGQEEVADHCLAFALKRKMRLDRSLHGEVPPVPSELSQRAGRGVFATTSDH
jgi:hypothetical protein